ncbi:hypothetical protein GRJ2_001805500 [Grus japonensis]|uniref:Uncharacterized protein n=1 Tax=Grus japonensis TaxID=30415 RepID=A0ABC9X8R4_GRUJA
MSLFTLFYWKLSCLEGIFLLSCHEIFDCDTAVEVTFLSSIFKDRELESIGFGLFLQRLAKVTILQGEMLCDISFREADNSKQPAMKIKVLLYQW